MKRAQLIVVGLAVVAGIGAFMLAGKKPPPQVIQQVVQPEAKPAPTTEILVVTSNLTVGSTLNEKNIAWKAWPNEALSKSYVKKSESPKAIEEYKGALVRYPILAGEPVNGMRISKVDGKGVLSALLAKGMRATAITIDPATAAGGFILPNDRVDIILTRNERSNGGQTSEIAFRNIRVLAIDQNVQEKDGEKVVIGRTATLELTEEQSKALELSKKLGTLSLALRSLADAPPDGMSGENLDLQQQSGTMTVIRAGVRSQSQFAQ